MSHFLIFLWINGKEEHVHPYGHFLWFLSHGLFGLFMVSVVNLVCFGFILFHEVSQPCPFLPLVCCLLEMNHLFLGTGRTPGLYFPQYFTVHPLQGHLLLSWPWGIQCTCSCGHWTIHAVIPTPNPTLWLLRPASGMLLWKDLRLWVLWINWVPWAAAAPPFLTLSALNSTAGFL